MSDEVKRAYRRAYSAGYNAGSRNVWPENAPPAPPDEKVRALLASAISLRNVADAFCATLEPHDELTAALSEKVEAIDAVLCDWKAWVRAKVREEGNE